MFEVVVRVIDGELYVGRTPLLNYYSALGAIQEEMRQFGLKQSGHFRDVETKSGELIPTMGFKLSWWDRIRGVPGRVRRYFEYYTMA